MNFLELLICAKAGDNEAAERILTMYQPILVKESVLDGALDVSGTLSAAVSLHSEIPYLIMSKQEGCLFRGILLFIWQIRKWNPLSCKR